MASTTGRALEATQASIPPWRFSGRFSPGAQDMFAPQTVSWAYSSITARFVAPAIAVDIDGLGFDVAIDGRVVRFIAEPEIFEGLDPTTTHTIVITKRIEAKYGQATFYGLELPKGGRFVSPPSPSPRRIEFIGDSITNGYGNLGSTAACKADWTNQDVSQAFGPLTAAALQAESHVIAWAGMGVFRGWWGDPAYNVPDLWRNAVAGDGSSTWDFASWVPHVVVINLGTNDFGRGIPDAAIFKNAYADFLEQIRSTYGGQTQIVCTLSPMLSGAAREAAGEYIRATVEASHAAGDTGIHFFEFDELDIDPVTGANAGCGWHPNVRTHQAMARALTSAILQIVDW